MKIKEYGLEVTIGLPEFTNIKPSIVFSDVDDLEEAHAKGKEFLDKVWRNTPLAKIKSPLSDHTEALGSTTDDFVSITPFVGEPFLYSDSKHEYRTLDGKALVSGSAFADQFAKPFNKEMILPKFAAKHGVSEKEISDMWTTKAEVSTTFGTAIHKALEFYGNHHQTIKKTQGAFDIHPVLMPIVKSFFDANPGHALHEIFVRSGERVGQIDRLVVTAPKTCIIEDWKTNGDLNKGTGKMLSPYESLPDTPLSHYRLQLSFYKKIMEENGWKVEGIRLHHFTGKWETIELQEVKV